MSSIFKKNKLFFILCALFVAFCSLQTLFYIKGNLVLYLNLLHTPIGNTFFKLITNIGDGLAFVIVSILLLLFVKIRWGIIGLLTFAASGLLSQFFKKIVFGDLPRPLKFFEGKEILHTVDGVHNAFVHSFPSGHTTTAFAMFTLLALFWGGNKTVAIVCFVLAVTTAISRIYLAQHFIEDVFAGTILGMLTAAIIYFWLEIKTPRLLAAPRLDYPLLKLKK